MAKSRFHSLLETRIHETIASKGDSLVAGAAIDYATYRDMAGYIRGLRDALVIADELETEEEA